MLELVKIPDKNLSFKKSYNFKQLLKELGVDISLFPIPTNPKALSFISKYKGQEEELLYEINRKWKEQVKIHHPDCGGDIEKIIRLNVIYDRLEYLLNTKEKTKIRYFKEKEKNKEEKRPKPILKIVKNPPKPKTRDLTGLKINSLKVIERAKVNSNRAYWLCLCDCGNYGVYRASKLVSKIKQIKTCLKCSISKFRTVNSCKIT